MLKKKAISGNSGIVDYQSIAIRSDPNAA